MTSLVNLITAPLSIVMNWLNGAWSLIQLLGLGLSAVSGSGGSVKSRLLDKVKAPQGQRLALAVLRAFLPNLVLSKSLVKAYSNSGTAILTRRDDVLDMLSRNDDFEVVYGTRMRKITDGENFFLGMQPGWPYTRDTSAMRLAARMSDVADIVLPRASAQAQDLVAAKSGPGGGKIDLPQDLTLLVPTDMVGHYFGTPGPSQDEMISWTTIMFWYLFVDLGADPEIETKAMEAAAAGRTYLDVAIAERKANPNDNEDILNRCLALQAAGTPGMDDLGIRNNMIGLLIGAIPTISKASVLAMDELLRRPDALAGAQRAAQSGDDALLAQYVWEALRFNPHQPLIYRRATRDAIIAPSTLRRRKIPKDTLVMGMSFSATFDGLEIPDANSFRVDRPSETYMTWGYGMHNCFGEAINSAVIPAILKPVLKLKNLRRAPGAEGQMDVATPFPQHLVLHFDPS